MDTILEIMFDRKGKLVMSNDKRPSVKLAVIAASTLLVVISIPFPVAELIHSTIHHLQPTAEFVFSVIALNMWNWITPSCLYVFLNILILVLGIQSGALTPSNSDNELEIQTHTNSITNMSMISGGCESDETSDSKANACTDLMKDMKEVDYLAAKSNGGLYCKKSKCTLLRRSTTGLSNLCRETTHVRSESSPHMDSVRESVVFEICAEVGEAEDEKVRRHEESLSSEELYAKAESFIGNFYRELKMQRENSWKRLCAIYKRSS